MGRKRLFDIDTALDAAMREFWLKGYEGTSLTDLTTAMGIEKPSLYRFFGNKDVLFQRVLERYEQQHLQFISHALNAPTVHDVARLLFRGLIRAVTQPQLPPGTLDLNAGIACSAECEMVRQKVVEWRAAHEKALIQRFKQAKRRGDLDDAVSAPALARYLMSVCAGVALQAKAGASRATLREIVDVAMLAVATAAPPPADPAPADFENIARRNKPPRFGTPTSPCRGVSPETEKHIKIAKPPPALGK